jgi:hypothetical protein
MFILIAFAIMVELTEYKMILLFLIATFEVFFGLGLLNCIHDNSNGYSVVTFRGFFIFTLHGLYSNNLIYYSINQHLFCCTAIWWAFCFGILAINIRRNFVAQLQSCLLSFANATLPPQNTTYIPTVTVTVPNIEDESLFFISKLIFNVPFSFKIVFHKSLMEMQ